MIVNKSSLYEGVTVPLRHIFLWSQLDWTNSAVTLEQRSSPSNKKCQQLNEGMIGDTTVGY